MTLSHFMSPSHLIRPSHLVILPLPTRAI